MKWIQGMLIAVALVPVACRNRQAADEGSTGVVKTPVTVCAMEKGSIAETIEMNATSVYLRKNEIRSSTSGYVDRVFVHIGDRVKPGDPLFRLKTKEAEALGNLKGKDSLYGIRGILPVGATSAGIITAVSVQASSFVNEGDVMAVMADQSSFAFILHVPYEFRNYTKVGTKCRILLADSTGLEGTVTSKLAEVDPASQTESFLVSVRTGGPLPENLNASASVIRNSREEAQILDKSCVLADETMHEFWVMRLVSDSVAVRVPVQTGIREGDRVEIVSPRFDPGERFILTGHYGLPDTARIEINH